MTHTSTSGPATAEPGGSIMEQGPVGSPSMLDTAGLHGGDGRSAEQIRGSTIPAAFASQVARHPDRPAVLADDARATYRQLGSAVAATAAALPAGKGPVAVLCRHGVATITALLAALVAGDAYVPLDPVLPARRLALILADAAARAVLVDAEHAELAGQLAALAGRPDLPIIHIRQSTVDVDPAALRGPAEPDDRAYILYTSGSTGTPKGVVQSHRNVLFGVTNHVRTFAIRPDDRTSVLTSFGYDMAVTDTFSALLSGAAAVPVDVRTHGLGHLAGALADRRVTIYHSTPTVYRYLVASMVARSGDGGRLPDVRAVLLGGEEVTRHDVTLARRHFAPGAVFVNGYGTTEISFAAQYHLPPDAALDHAVVPIGHPLPGIDIVLVDDTGRSGETGEIVVRTPHVALGYLGLPDLTAGRFGEHDGVRAYRTGDLARRLPDGRLVYLGRADRMVKIRGYRVELGEIEAQLAALPGVARAAVVARPAVTRSAAVPRTPPAEAGAEARTEVAVLGPGEQDIIGYVVLAAPIDGQTLRGQLAAVLPDFMLPRAIVVVADLPIGPTGKLDQAALPDPPPLNTAGPSATADAPAAGVDGAGGSTAGPVGPGAGPVGSRAGHEDRGGTVGRLEQIIAASWAEALGLTAVDRQANFFDLGGHSLQLALVQGRLEEGLGRRVSLARLVEFPTIAGLAQHLTSDRPDADGRAEAGRLTEDDGGARLARVDDRMRRRRQARAANGPAGDGPAGNGPAGNKPAGDGPAGEAPRAGQGGP